MKLSYTRKVSFYPYIFFSQFHTLFFSSWKMFFICENVLKRSSGGYLFLKTNKRIEDFMCEIEWKTVLAGENKNVVRLQKVLQEKEIKNYLVSHVTFSFFSWKCCVTHEYKIFWKSLNCEKENHVWDYCENLLVSLGLTHYIVFFSQKGFCHVPK